MLLVYSIPKSQLKNIFVFAFLINVVIYNLGYPILPLMTPLWTQRCE